MKGAVMNIGKLVREGYYISVTEAADRYGISRTAVKAACNRNTVACYMVGTTFIICARSAERKWGWRRDNGERG
jgi:hypothetical protein